jgi:hypothetical protein
MSSAPGKVASSEDTNSNKKRLRQYLVSRNESEATGFESEAPASAQQQNISIRIATGLSAREASSNPFSGRSGETGTSSHG